MRKRFDDQTIVVTGSTRGIGAAIARRFGREGANVVVSGRTETDGKTVVDTITQGDGDAIFIQTDMRKVEDIEQLVERTVSQFGGIAGIVNNAAVETNTGAGEATHEDWDLVLETDFRGYWLCAREAVQHMNRGAIVNVSSNHARLTMPKMFPYNAVKAGIEGMTRAMALDFGPHIRVNSVTPGWVAVDRTVEDMSAERRRELAGIHPVGRLGEPEDIAAPVAFLASEEAQFVTGASLLVDGGRTAVMQDDVLPDYAALRNK